jgi:hypothetical protein
MSLPGDEERQLVTPHGPRTGRVAVWKNVRKITGHFGTCEKSLVIARNADQELLRPLRAQRRVRFITQRAQPAVSLAQMEPGLRRYPASS